MDPWQESAMLRLSKLADYGTAILGCLASQSGRLWRPAQVAERTHVGLPSVRKLLQKLRRSDLLSSAHGSHGGYQLACPSGEISAARILDALEGPFAITECSGQHSNCGIEANCRVGHVWQRVNGAIRRALTDITLAQLAGLERGSSTIVPLTR